MEAKKEKQQIFVSIVILGAAGVIATNIFTTPRQLQFIMLVEVVIFVLIMYLIFYGIPGIVKRIEIQKSAISHLPKIKHWFELVKQNDLRLYIFNPPHAKPVRVKCLFKEYRTICGENYLWDQDRRLELKLIEDRGNGPIFYKTLKPNDTREIQLGSSWQGKLSLFSGEESIFEKVGE